MRHRFRLATLSTLVVLGCILGVAGAIGRGQAVMGSTSDTDHAVPSGYDRMGVKIGTALVGVQPGSARYREYEADVAFFSSKYLTYRSPTLWHVIPAAFLLLLAPLQFVAGIRTRYLGLHRWSGRVLLVVAVPIALSGLFLGIVMPFGGVSEAIAVMLFGGVFMFAGARAFIAVRKGDIAHHREWMLRMFAVAVGISTIRVVDLLLMRVTEASPQAMFSVSLWLGWSLTLGITELWIRSTRGDVETLLRVPG